MPETASGQQTANSVDVEAGLDADRWDRLPEWERVFWHAGSTPYSAVAKINVPVVHARALFEAGWNAALERSGRTQEQLLQHSEGYLHEIKLLRVTLTDTNRILVNRDAEVEQLRAALLLCVEQRGCELCASRIIDLG